VLVQRGVSADSLAEACEVDPKTWDDGWAAGCPTRGTVYSAARYLRVEEAFLWPGPQPRTDHHGGALASDLVGTYPDRASVPRET
jgi:hypothetical protein